jgi:hypothetical protein
MWPRGGQNKTVGQARSWVPLTRALGGGKNRTLYIYTYGDTKMHLGGFRASGASGAQTLLGNPICLLRALALSDSQPVNAP